MAKISDITSYPNQSPVVLADDLIGTDNTTKATKTFTVQDLANAINTYVPSGTQYTLAMFNTTSSIGDSMISQNAAGTEMTFGSASTGASLDMQQNKLVFASDATNTFIRADSVTPESLEIYADNDVNLLADRHVIINGTVPADPASTGVRGAIIYDNDYIYICVQTNTWKRVAISTW